MTDIVETEAGMGSVCISYMNLIKFDEGQKQRVQFL